MGWLKCDEDFLVLLAEQQGSFDNDRIFWIRLFFGIFNYIIYALTANLHLDPYNLMAFIVFAMPARFVKRVRYRIGKLLEHAGMIAHGSSHELVSSDYNYWRNQRCDEGITCFLLLDS